MESQSDEDKNRDDKSLNAAPGNNALLSILGNALGSIVHEKSSAGLETKKCPNCSAARPSETDLQYCDYCGFKFY